ncbi:MAG: hypothetical protein NTX17_01935 [Candidatus Eisenbacteria bacterium]|nr:hypothetical protein [Candidatus Eisenbacteria bacterium]
MNRKLIWLSIGTLIVLVAMFVPNGSAAKEIVRPEEIRSMRQVVYSEETYAKLAGLWKEYSNEYPSEYAYANWMYAARYAGDKKYWELLAKGLKKYPANPTLMYLKSLEHQGVHNDVEGRKYLERVIAVDPNYVDAWFALVVRYMDLGDQERLDVALRRLLESGIIADEVMDYNYNMLASLQKDAILVTNGDNDTYPGWILTRVLKVRPDVSIVNRSLLNTDWYPMYVTEHGLPRFISTSELNDLRNSILRESKKSDSSPSPGGLFGDVLIFKIIESAERAGRPVYLSRTVNVTGELKNVTEKGRNLGLVTLVTPSQTPYAEQLRKVYRTWIETFRTGGLESWRLQNAPQAAAGRWLVTNYAAAVAADLESLRENAPELRTGLFRWYVDHVDGLIPEHSRYETAQAWCCCASDLKEIDSWCKEQGLKCNKQ